MAFAAAGLMVWAWQGAGAMPAGKDEIVPEGAIALQLSVFREEQSLAFDRTGNLHQLRKILIPHLTVRRHAKGDVDRTVTDYNLGLTFGISDTWNILVQAPYRVLEQDSDIRSTTDNADHTEEIESFRSQTLSGFGDVRVMTMFRPVFSDRNGFVWGYGFTHPVTEQTGKRPGLYTLTLRSPNPTLRSFVHYTHYPRTDRSRIDLRGELEIGLPGSIEHDDGHTNVYRSGNAVQLEIGYTREIGPVGVGISIEEFRQGASHLGGVNQSDPEQETVVHWRLGYGNLQALEEGPLALPYEVTLEFDRSLFGFNVPYSDGYTLTLLLFF